MTGLTCNTEACLAEHHLPHTVTVTVQGTKQKVLAALKNNIDNHNKNDNGNNDKDNSNGKGSTDDDDNG